MGCLTLRDFSNQHKAKQPKQPKQKPLQAELTV